MAVSTKKLEVRKQKELLKEAREAAEVAAGKLLSESAIDRDVDRIGIPLEVDIPDAINFLQRLDAEEGNAHTETYTFNYLPWDGAYCATNAIRRQFGSLLQKGQKVETLFGTQELPPQHINVPSGPGESVSVLWGGVVVPIALKTVIYFGAIQDPEKGSLFQIQSQGPYRDRFVVKRVADLIAEELQTNSLYKGKVFDCADMPNFEDVARTEIPIFDAKTEASISANILLPLKAYDKLEEFEVSLKSAILLEGYFGTGKTMVMRMAAKVAQENGWTFIFVRPNVDTIERAVQIAALYEPSVIAFEDVDNIASAEEEALRISQIHDLFDGLRSKSKRVMMILTTNHVEDIHAGVIRPGRMDRIIRVPKPDAEAIQKILQKYTPAELLADDIDWQVVTDAMEGYFPAFVREASKSAIRYGLDNANGDGFKLGTDELAYAGHDLRRHFEILERAKTKPEAPTLDKQLRDLVGKQVTEKTEQLLNQYL